LRQIHLLFCMFGFVLSACGGGESSAPAPSLSASENIAPPIRQPASTITLSGQVSYDFIPHDPVTFGLDYNGMSARAVTSVRVDLLDAGEEILGTSITDAAGAYSFDVEQDQRVKVRVSASLSVDNGESWSFTVRDNVKPHLLQFWRRWNAQR